MSSTNSMREYHLIYILAIYKYKDWNKYTHTHTHTRTLNIIAYGNGIHVRDQTQL
jgi:hypothetical protein